jgi:hypothetical protein
MGRMNLWNDGNRKGTSLRKARLKVEMNFIGAETIVVVKKLL